MATIKKAQSGSKLKKDEFRLKALQFQETQKQNAINNEREARKRAEKNIEKSPPLEGEKMKYENTITTYQKKKMKNGGSLSGLKASNKRVGPVDPKGAFTTVQKKTLAGAKGKASLTKDKQLGATKMAKCGTKMSKK
jgi:hypothetical protein